MSTAPPMACWWMRARRGRSSSPAAARAKRPPRRPWSPIIVEIARGSLSRRYSAGPPPVWPRWSPLRRDAAPQPWYLRFEVLDRAGRPGGYRRASVAAGVSIESMIQRGRAPGEPVAIVMITHETRTERRRARLEGHLRLRQGAFPALHDSHGSRIRRRSRMTSMTLIRPPTTAQAAGPRIRARSGARHRSGRHRCLRPDRARRRACRRPGGGRGDARGLQRAAHRRHGGDRRRRARRSAHAVHRRKGGAGRPVRSISRSIRWKAPR